MLTFQDYARHPKLTKACEKLASMSKLDDADRLAAAEGLAASLGLTALDIEMTGEGAVPFAATKTGGDTYQDAVARHVHAAIRQ